MSVRLSGLARREYWLLAVLLTCAAFVWYGNAFAARLSQPAYLVGIFAWLFVAILGSALSVVRHADRLAVRLGEPYGTLILTLSVVVIEVASFTAIMLHGENNPTLTRDTLFAVVMIILNGMVGLALLVGGLRHREQHYNLQGANAYLGVILPLIAFSLLLPDFTQTTPGPTLSIGQSAFIAIVAVGLYATFLALQTGRHRNYFTFEDGDLLEKPEEGGDRGHPAACRAAGRYMMPVVYLAGQLAPPADYVIETMGAPDAVGGGVAIAILVATPEAIGAVRAALANRVRGRAYLAAAEALVDNVDQARLHLAKLDELDPGMTIKRFAEERSSFSLEAVSSSYLCGNERLLNGLRRAGMPVEAPLHCHGASSE